MFAFTAQSRPSPLFEVGSGAPKITAGTPPTFAATAGVDAIPGLDGLHMVMETSAGLAAGGYFHRNVPVVSRA